MNKKFALTCVCFLILFSPTLAKEIPKAAKPEEVGMSTAGLEKVKAVAAKIVADNKAKGITLAIVKDGKLVLNESYGQRAIKSSMQNDTIFRIYSMSKLITSIAALKLYEEGKIDLDAPIGKYVPEMKNLELYKEGGNVTPKRQPTVRDLMRHTSGLTYGIMSNTPVDKMCNRAGILTSRTTAVMTQKLGRIPLLYEPGTRFNYGFSTDVLGRIVEIVSGKALDVFLQENIFTPLEMEDTGFYVPREKVKRFSTCYTKISGKLVPIPFSTAKLSKYHAKPTQLSGGGGLVSTTHDYLQVLLMLLNNGELNGKRILKASTVKLITTNQLSKEMGWVQFGNKRLVGKGHSLGCSVFPEKSTWSAAPAGEFAWDGIASSHYWVSPKDKLAVVIMQQLMPFSMHADQMLKGPIYEAIEKP